MIEYVATCRKLSDVPRGAEIVRVNGRGVVGTCENCGKFVYQGTEYTSWSDGPYTHKGCPRGQGTPGS